MKPEITEKELWLALVVSGHSADDANTVCDAFKARFGSPRGETSIKWVISDTEDVPQYAYVGPPADDWTWVDLDHAIRFDTLEEAKAFADDSEFQSYSLAFDPVST